MDLRGLVGRSDMDWRVRSRREARVLKGSESGDGKIGDSGIGGRGSAGGMGGGAIEGESLLCMCAIDLRVRSARESFGFTGDGSALATEARICSASKSSSLFWGDG